MDKNDIIAHYQGQERQIEQWRREQDTELESQRSQAEGDISRMSSASEAEAQRLLSEARARESKEQRKRDLPISRPSDLGTAALLAAIEAGNVSYQQKARAAQAELKKRYAEAVEALNKQEAEQKAQVEASRELSLKEWDEYQKAIASARPTTESTATTAPANAIQLNSGEYVDKTFYDSLDSQQQAVLLKRGVDVFNDWIKGQTVVTYQYAADMTGAEALSKLVSEGKAPEGSRLVSYDHTTGAVKYEAPVAFNTKTKEPIYSGSITRLVSTPEQASNRTEYEEYLRSLGYRYIQPETPLPAPKDFWEWERRLSDSIYNALRPKSEAQAIATLLLAGLSSIPAVGVNVPSTVRTAVTNLARSEVGAVGEGVEMMPFQFNLPNIPQWVKQAAAVGGASVASVSALAATREKWVPVMQDLLASLGGKASDLTAVVSRGAKELPEDVRAGFNALAAAYNDFYARFGRAPTDSDILVVDANGGVSSLAELTKGVTPSVIATYDLEPKPATISGFPTSITEGGLTTFPAYTSKAEAIHSFPVQLGKAPTGTTVPALTTIPKLHGVPKLEAKGAGFINVVAVAGRPSMVVTPSTVQIDWDKVLTEAQEKYETESRSKAEQSAPTTPLLVGSKDYLAQIQKLMDSDTFRRNLLKSASKVQVASTSPSPQVQGAQSIVEWSPVPRTIQQSVSPAISRAVSSVLANMTNVTPAQAAMVGTVVRSAMLTGLYAMAQGMTASQINTALRNAVNTGLRTVTDTAVRTAVQAATATIVNTLARSIARTATRTAVREAATTTNTTLLPLPKTPKTSVKNGEAVKVKDGTLAWKQGFIYRYIPPPWNKSKPDSSRTPIQGFVDKGNTPQASLQVIGKRPVLVPKEFSIDLGEVDAFITGYGTIITFAGRGTKTDVGKRLSSTTKGMSVGREESMSDELEELNEENLFAEPENPEDIPLTVPELSKEPTPSIAESLGFLAGSAAGAVKSRLKDVPLSKPTYSADAGGNIIKTQLVETTIPDTEEQPEYKDELSDLFAVPEEHDNDMEVDDLFTLDEMDDDVSDLVAVDRADVMGGPRKKRTIRRVVRTVIKPTGMTGMR